MEGTDEMDIVESDGESDLTESIADDDEDDRVFIARLLGIDPQVVIELNALPDTDDSDSDTDSSSDASSQTDLDELENDSSVTYSESRGFVFFPDFACPSSSSIPEEPSDSPPWDQLPDVAMVKVFRNLSEGDRFSAALTCKKWSKLFHTPCLWRRRSIQFGGGLSSRREYLRATGFVKAHAQYLQFLRICCHRPTFYTCKRFQTTMDEVFVQLMKTRYSSCCLKEFLMPQLHLERYWRYTNVRTKLLRSLIRFLKQQHTLDIWDMAQARVAPLPGMTVINAVAKCNAHNLDTLNMEDFFHARCSPFRIDRYCEIIGKFTNVSSLYTNYNYISDEVLEIMTKSLAKKLKFMSIKVNDTDPHVHRIHSLTWKNLSKACPSLAVHMFLQGIGDFAESSVILAKNMPLTSLQIWSGVPAPDQRWRFDQTVLNLGHNYADCLEEVSLMLENAREPIDDALLDMIQRCKSLEYLDFQAVLEVPTVNKIYGLTREGKTQLNRCHMTLENLTGIEVTELEAINHLHEKMVEERGLDFQIEPSEMVMF